MALDPFYKSVLEEYIFIIAGFRISSRKDCDNLSNLIVKKVEQSLSPITLYRIFQAKNYENSPTRTTLDILAKFCTFENWAAFEKNANDLFWVNMQLTSFSDNSKSPTLLSLSIKNGHFETLEELFSIDSTRTLSNFFGKYAYGKVLFHALADNPDKCRAFFDRFSGSEIIRAAFFEMVSETGFQIADFEYGLGCYLSQMESLDEVTQLRDTTYAQCLLFKNAVLNNNEAQWRKIGNQLLNELDVDPLLVPDKFHIFPYARLLGCRYLYQVQTTDKKVIAEAENQLFSEITTLLPRLNLDQQKPLLYFVTDALFLHKDSKKMVEKLHDIFEPTISQLPSFPKPTTLKKMLSYMDMNIFKAFLKTDGLQAAIQKK